MDTSFTSLSVCIVLFFLGIFLGNSLTKEYDIRHTKNVGEVIFRGYGEKYKWFAVADTHIREFRTFDKEEAIKKLVKENAGRTYKEESLATLVEVYYKDVQ